MKFKRIGILAISLIMLLSTGCWDKIETEQRAFIYAMYIDLADNKSDKGGSDVFVEQNPPKLHIGFGMLVPAKLQSGEKAFTVRWISGIDMADAMEKLGSETSRVPFYGHLRLINFTEGLLKDEVVFKQVLNQFDRMPVINQQAKVAVAKFSPEDISQVEPKLENTISGYISGIMENARYSSYATSENLGDTLTQMRNNDGSMVMPVVDKVKDSLEIIRLALIKDYKFLSYLDTKYVKPYKIINGELKRGREIVGYKGIAVPYRIASSERKIWMDESDDRLKYTVQIELEGDIEQFEYNKELFDPDLLRNIEGAISESLTKELQEATYYFQKVVGHDYLGFQDYTLKNHNKIYKQYKNNWDEQFRKAEIDYVVKVNIRRIGASRK